MVMPSTLSSGEEEYNVALTRQYDELPSPKLLCKKDPVNETSNASFSLAELRNYFPKFIITDLDSTFWNSDGICPDLNKWVSNKLKQKGIPQIICTGRSLEGAQRGLAINKLNSLSPFPGIYNDGGIIYGESVDQEISCVTLPLECIKDLMSLALQIDPTCRFTFVLKHSHMTDDRKFLESFNAWQDTIIERPGLPEEGECLSLCIFSNNPYELHEHLLCKQPQFEYLRYDDVRLVLVRPPGVNKLTAIRKLMKHYGWADSRTLVIGDGLNDIEMLRDMKLSIVMKDGHQSALAVAKFKTELPSFEGGWGDAMQHVFSLD